MKASLALAPNFQSPVLQWGTVPVPTRITRATAAISRIGIALEQHAVRVVQLKRCQQAA